MYQMRVLKISAVLLILTLLLSCASSPLPIQAFNVNTKEGRAVMIKDRHIKNSGMNVDNAIVIGLNDGVVLGDIISPLLNRIVYFKYDSSGVSEDVHEILAYDAAYIGSHANVTVYLAGHTDKCGSREYNLALGERRAFSIRQILILYGASVSQFEVVSFGEERLAVDSSDESVWERNRRVEIRYVEH